MRIHVPAIPHTRPTAAYSHCAFTTKARLLPKLLKLAYPDALITWYGVGWDRPEGADACVPVMSEEKWASLFDRGVTAANRFVGEQAHVDHPGYVAFNAALADSWSETVSAGDIVCFPFGHAHQGAASAALMRGGLCVETGIGYPTPFLPFRIYESRAWLHYVAGKTGCEGSDYHFVAPHYYDEGEWQYTSGDRTDVVYVGRLIESKGLAHVAAIADACPDLQFTLYGQGDATPYLRPNVRYGGVLDREGVKKAFLGAKAALFPTRYIEPFCQAHIEALLCGCPVVGSDFGVFPETAQAFSRCDSPAIATARTLPEWVDAVRMAVRFHDGHRATFAKFARDWYGLERIARRYRHILDTIRATATPAGWYGEHFTTRHAA